MEAGGRTGEKGARGSTRRRKTYVYSELSPLWCSLGLFVLEQCTRSAYGENMRYGSTMGEVRSSQALAAAESNYTFQCVQDAFGAPF